MAQSHTRTPGRRIGSIDALRAVMCAGIALYHLAPYYFGPGDPIYDASRYCSYFTDMFFVFAGLFIARSASFDFRRGGDFPDFLARRLARLYPLHFVTLLFYVAIAMALETGVLQSTDPDRYDWRALLPNLTLTHAWGIGPPLAFNFQSWAISAILACYLALPLLGAAARGREWMWVGGFALALALAQFLALALDASPTDLQRHGAGAIRAAPSFLFGLLLGRWRPSAGDRRMVAILLALVLLFAFARSTPLDGLPRLAAVYALVAAVVAVDAAALWTPLALPLVQALGKYSFGVYLLHSVVGTLLFRMAVAPLVGGDLPGFADRRPALAAALLALGIALSFAAAAISLITIEKYGARAFMALLRRPKRRAPPRGA